MSDYISGRSSSNTQNLSTKKQNAGFDAAASEKMRAEAATKARHKEEKLRAQNKLADLKRVFERNQLDIAEKEREERRLQMEIAHSTSELRAAEQMIKMSDSRGNEISGKITEEQAYLQRMQKETFESKRQTEEHNIQIERIEHQISELQHKLNLEKASLYEAHVKMQKLELEANHAEGAMHKEAGLKEHSKAEKALKEKDVENKKRAISLLEQKKTATHSEMDRLESEQKKLENQIKTIEASAELAYHFS